MFNVEVQGFKQNTNEYIDENPNVVKTGFFAYIITNILVMFTLFLSKRIRFWCGFMTLPPLIPIFVSYHHTIEMQIFHGRHFVILSFIHK